MDVPVLTGASEGRGTMWNDEVARAGVIAAASRGAGTCIGTAAAIGRRIVGRVVAGIAAVGALFDRPVKGPALVEDDDIGPASPASLSGAARAAAPEDAPGAPAAARSDAVAAPTREEPGGPGPSEVTTDQVRAAAFDSEADRIILARALSDMASREAAARVDAAKAMAGVRHGLSVRALVGQMSREPSAQVRRECVKTLSTLGGTEGLAAVERALKDRAASVRLAAVWGLYRLAGSQGGRALTQMLSDQDEQVRRRAATCIGWLGREELARELPPLLDDGSVAVRRAAVEAMGKLGSWQVVSALIEHLNDPDRSIGKAVLGALEAITGKRMGKRLPADERLRRRLMARWRHWWKEGHPE